MAFLDRLEQCANFKPTEYLPFVVDGARVGLVRPSFAQRLAEFPEVFAVSARSVTLTAGLQASAERTEAVASVARALADRGLIRGWRDEPYPVSTTFEGDPLFFLERAAVPSFGVRASGVHLNGVVRVGRNVLMWVGRRSLNKATAPGKLDQLVAGGRSAGHTVRQTLVKEAKEEAGIPSYLVEQARAVGAITYVTEQPEGLRRDCLYVFDLELPIDFVPKNQDGEITEFYLWPIERVMETVRETQDFKFNCALVVVDFLIRHGYLAPADPEYAPLVRRFCSLSAANEGC